MKGIAEVLRTSPLSMRIFSAAHALLGLLVLVELVLAYPKDTPCQPGVSGFDACGVVFESPWTDGTWPYFLIILIAFMVSSVMLLIGSRIARCVLLVAIAAYWVYSIYDLLDVTRRTLELNTAPGVYRGWIAAWKELFRTIIPAFWLVLPGWVALDAWFLFSARFKRHFRVVA